MFFRKQKKKQAIIKQLGNYKNIWVVLVNVVATKNVIFSELIENKNKNLVGAWAYVFAKSDDIKQVPKIVENGLKEYKLKMVEIDKIEKFTSYVQFNKMADETIKTVTLFTHSKYIFERSAFLYPYTKEQMNDDLYSIIV